MLDPLVECVRAQTIECVNEVCMALAKYLRQKKTGHSALQSFPRPLFYQRNVLLPFHLKSDLNLWLLEILIMKNLVHKWGKQVVVDTTVTLKMLQFWTLDNEKRSQMKCLVSTNALDSRVSIYLMLVWQNTSVCNKISMQRSFNACANTLCFMMMHHHLVLCCVVAFPTTKDDPPRSKQSVKWPCPSIFSVSFWSWSRCFFH